MQALKSVDLDIHEGEIIALLGPNGAGKTTLISIVCGLVMPTAGSVRVAGLDILTDYRETRRRIGLVPQDMPIDAFESVWDTVQFSRRLFGLPPNDAYLTGILEDLALTDKRDTNLMTLSGGMKRRVLIAKALAHEPPVLFLDEPTAGVDVELRKDMWSLIRKLAAQGVTIILTTHYIEEAEDLADRISVIRGGEIILTENKRDLMQRLGQKSLQLHLNESLQSIPASLASYSLKLSEDGYVLTYEFDTQARKTGITGLVAALADAGITFRDIDSRESSLEEIFVGLVKEAS